MFYANFILSKKGPLARVWLAAHWEKKLSKTHVFETDVESSVESIMSPKVKMALRTSGHLLLGVVRIYSRKAKYLLADCTEAFVKIKMAFRPGVVDLPEDGREAAMSAVTLPEMFTDFDMPLNDFDIQVQFNLNQSRAEEITLKEDFIVMNAFGDEGFGDIPFGVSDEREVLREGSALDDSSFMHSKDASKLLLEESNGKDPSNASLERSKLALELDEHIRDDGFGGLANDILGGDGFGDEFGEGILPPLEDLPTLSAFDVTLEPLQEVTVEINGDNNQMEIDEKIVEENDDVEAPGLGNETTIVQNDAEAFVLEPVEILHKEKRSKRKRKLIVDDEKILASNVICNQLANTEDIIKPATLAPPTKLRMRLKETSTSDKLFNLPAMSNMAPTIRNILVQNLTSKITHDQDVDETAERMELDDRESPQEEHRDAVEEQIKSPRSPRKRKSAHSTETDDQTAPEGLPFEAERPVEEETEINLEHYEGVSEFIPEEESRLDIELNEPEVPESQMTDEQASGEKDEEFQERRWTKRTQQLMHTLKRELKTKDAVPLDDLAKEGNRKQVACKFYSCLLLKRDNEIELQQKNAFEEILVSKGPSFYT